MDLCLLTGSVFLAVALRRALTTPLGLLPKLSLAQGIWPPVIICVGIWLLALAYEGVHGIGLSSLDNAEKLVKAMTGGLVVMVILTFFVHAVDLLPRTLLIIAYALALALLVLVRPLLLRYVRRLTHVQNSVVLLGGGLAASQVLVTLQSSGLSVITAPLDSWQPESLPFATSVIICTPGAALSAARLAAIESFFDEVAFVPPSAPPAFSTALPINIRGTQVFVLRHPLNRHVNRMLKRFLDAAGAAAILLLLSPVLAALAVAIKASSPGGPILFKHRRLGRDGRHFLIYKFRTMVPDAEARLRELLRSDPAARREFETTFKLKHDPRVTAIGRVLRRLSLDEIPQLLNVLRGEMSLVGPRPIVDDEVPYYGPLYSVVSTVKPGMTGLWQTSGRSDTSYAARVSFDLSYVRGWSVWTDFGILIRTLQEMILSSAY
jgi:Undecaprenyl-phosphate galactose phosphotransferase WbaP